MHETVEIDQEHGYRMLQEAHSSWTRKERQMAKWPADTLNPWLTTSTSSSRSITGLSIIRTMFTINTTWHQNTVPSKISNVLSQSRCNKYRQVIERSVRLLCTKYASFTHIPQYINLQTRGLGATLNGICIVLIEFNSAESVIRGLKRVCTGSG